MLLICTFFKDGERIWNEFDTKWTPKYAEKQFRKFETNGKIMPSVGYGKVLYMISFSQPGVALSACSMQVAQYLILYQATLFLNKTYGTEKKSGEDLLAL